MIRAGLVCVAVSLWLCCVATIPRLPLEPLPTPLLTQVDREQIEIMIKGITSDPIIKMERTGSGQVQVTTGFGSVRASGGNCYHFKKSEGPWRRIHETSVTVWVY